MAFLRVLYWFQISETFGPVVLNITRVFTDIFTILSTYVVILLAFSLGITYLVSSDDSKDDNTLNEADNISDYTSKYLQITLAMFWATVNPGPNEDHIPDKGVNGIAATTLFIIYQACVVVILMNLLIAIMNSTIQKQEDKKLLYWKFARSSVWIEYYNDSKWGLPPPLNVILLPMFCIRSIYYIFSSLIECCAKYRNRNCENCFNGKLCKMNQKERQRRKEHAMLMKNLVHRCIQIKNKK
jgi:hypothetical protein